MRQIYIFIAFVVLILTIDCTTQSTRYNYILSVFEKKICDSLQIDTTLILDIRNLNLNKIEPFHYSLSKVYQNGKWIESEPVKLIGLVFSEQNSRSYETVFKLKDKFKKKGYSIFLLENNFNIDNQLDNIGVLKTIDKFDILKQINTDGINYEITNDSLIAIIKKFDKKYSLELIGASGDWCEFVIHKVPSDWLEFAKDTYEVCPDIVDQGTGTVEALASEMKRTKRLYFWWD